MRPVIWHNPDCGTSTNVLHVLQECGTDPDILLYREAPPDRQALVQAISASGMTVRDALRRRGTPFDELGLGDPALSDNDLLDAVARHPILINRPFVTTARGTKLCRPAEMVFDLLDTKAPPGLTRKNGTSIVVDRPVAATDDALLVALAEAGLPTEDMADTKGHFFSYATPDGRHAGYAGFELYDGNALLRSVVVDDKRRGQGLAKAIVPLVLRRAWDAGAREAWLLTDTAPEAFAALGFAKTDRSAAPAGLQASPEFATICPASAECMTKVITL